MNDQAKEYKSLQGISIFAAKFILICLDENKTLTT
jgi:hypothetical protein